MLRDIRFVQEKLRWMREERIWPNGLRYLWTDAFGVLLLASLARELRDERFLLEAEWVVSEVERVLGRPRGLRIGEAPERDGQYFHYLAMWMYALGRLGEFHPKYRRRAIQLAREVHPAFVDPELGVVWKMREDLSGPYPGTGMGLLDPFHGYVVYRQLDPRGTELAEEIADMKDLVGQMNRGLRLQQDLGLGMMLWLTHFFPEEPWAMTQRRAALEELDSLWEDPPGYFCRGPGLRRLKYAFTNYGVSLGLQSVNASHERVVRLNAFFDGHLSGDEYDRDAITHVMACTSHFPGMFIIERRPEETVSPLPP